MRETGKIGITCNLCFNRSISLYPTQLEEKFSGVWATWYQIGEIDVCPICAMAVYSAHRLEIISGLIEQASMREDEQERALGRLVKQRVDQ